MGALLYLFLWLNLFSNFCSKHLINQLQNKPTQTLYMPAVLISIFNV